MSRDRLPETEAVALAEAARYLRVRFGWLRRKVQDGTIRLVSYKGRAMVDKADVEAFGNSDEYWQYKDDERTRSLEDPYVPDHVRDYHRFHSFLNDFTWLLKAFHTPRVQLRDQRFRLDHLFQHYVKQTPPASKVTRLLLGGEELDAESRERAARSLKKAWYNELAYASPQLALPLILDRKGVPENLDSAADRLLFPSWRITQAYYVSYHAGRTLADLCGLSYRPEQHHSPLRVFKSCKLSPARQSIIQFPFSLATSGRTADEIVSEHLKLKPHLRYGYANHPRPPRRSYEQTLRACMDGMRRFEERKNSSSGAPYMLSDVLSEFRVWANYVDVENIVGLKSQGFRTYLDLDLHTLTFFQVGLVELAALAILGVDTVLLLAEEFHDEFVRDDAALWKATALHPLSVRFSIYRHMDRLDGRHWEPELPKGDVRLELLPFDS